MANTFTVAELADFEKNFKPTAAATPAADAQTAGESEASANSQTVPDDATSENQSADSPAEDTALGDDNVDSSAADTTTADDPDDSGTAEPTSETADQRPAKAKGRAQARIEGLVADNKALKASLDYLQNQVLAKLPQTQAAQPAAVATTTAPAAPSADEAPPTLESCGFDTAKWTEAVNAWTRKQIDAGVAKAVQTVKQEQTVATRVQGFQNREAAFAATTPDYGVVIGNPALPRLAPDPAQLVLDSEIGPQILYHLGKNPEKAARIARMNPVQQAAAVGRLEAELSVAQKTPKPSQKTTTNNITRAPNPPTPTTGRGNTPSVDPSKMSSKEWIEWDRQQTMIRRRAAKAARTG